MAWRSSVYWRPYSGPSLDVRCCHHPVPSALGGRSLGYSPSYRLTATALCYAPCTSLCLQHVHTRAGRQLAKVEHTKTRGLLQPLTIPTRKWQSVHMDWIVKLPQWSTKVEPLIRCWSLPTAQQKWFTSYPLGLKPLLLTLPPSSWLMW